MTSFAVNSFEVIQAAIPLLPDMVSLQCSLDGGRTWGEAISQSMGEIGKYDTSISFWNLGMSRNMLFKLSWSSNFKTALQGAFVFTETAST
jgi:hypothetical protein